jgi:hypothetical protein
LLGREKENAGTETVQSSFEGLFCVWQLFARSSLPAARGKKVGKICHTPILSIKQKKRNLNDYSVSHVLTKSVLPMC